VKVLDLHCEQGHGFEGWFASEDDFVAQSARQLVECPLCGSHQLTKRPSAPRLNLRGAEKDRAPAERPAAAPEAAGKPVDVVHPGARELQAAWLQAVRHVMANTEDVGEGFAEEARRIHYGEAAERGIRGKATPEQGQALRDEGIEVMALPIPESLKKPLQ
jgi:hypothetical protein